MSETPSSVAQAAAQGAAEAVEEQQQDVAEQALIVAAAEGAVVASEQAAEAQETADMAGAVAVEAEQTAEATAEVAGATAEVVGETIEVVSEQDTRLNALGEQVVGLHGKIDQLLNRIPEPTDKNTSAVTEVTVGGDDSGNTSGTPRRNATQQQSGPGTSQPGQPARRRKVGRR